MFAKKNGFISLFRPPIIQNRSNFIILSLFNGGVIYISPLYEFLYRKRIFPSLGRFSNMQKYFLSLSFRDVKYSSTQYIVPGSKLWGNLPSVMTSISGWFFISTKIYQAWKILVSIKNHPLTLVHNRGQVYAIPCFTGKYSGWKCTIHYHMIWFGNRFLFFFILRSISLCKKGQNLYLRERSLNVLKRSEWLFYKFTFVTFYDLWYIVHTVHLYVDEILQSFGKKYILNKNKIY